MLATDKIKIFETYVDTLNEFNVIVTAKEDDLNPPSKKKKKSKLNENCKTVSYSELELLLGIYKLLILDFKKYSQRWKFDCLTKWATSEKGQTEDSSMTKWLALEILCLVFSMTPFQKDKFFRMYFTSSDVEDLTFKFDQMIVGSELVIVNKENIEPVPRQEFRTNFTKKDIEIYRRKVFQVNEVKLNENQSTSLMEVDKQKNDELILVETSKANLERLELSISSDKCIIVEGPLSCGKTSLIEHMAKKIKKNLIKYQMDDFMDSKALIGSYICSDVPGEFMWKPGPLFKAVTEDCWLLLEDFDNSPVDSLSLLIDLLETKCIKTSTNSSIEIKANFRLFLTMRSGLKQSSNLHFIDSIKKFGRSVEIYELTELDIKEIICRKYPTFYSANKNKIIDIVLEICHELQMFDSFKAMKSMSSGNDIFTRVRDVRHLSMRDLLKLFERFTQIRDTDDRKAALCYLQDIYDCFLSSIQSKIVRTELTINAGYKFHINKEEIQNLLIDNKPVFDKQLDRITCGRVTLSLDHLLNDANNNILNKTSLTDGSVLRDFFVYTRASLKLLEQVARCIECNEPVLLCGETGVGKTSSLQHLAKVLGKKISVINLSQQTETGDLLGSYKPVDIKAQMKMLKEKFLVLFKNSFSESENETFLGHIQKCYSDSNWRFLLKLLIHATTSAYKKFLKEKAKKSIVIGWQEYRTVLTKINENFEQMMNKFSFQFFEGVLTKAIVNGEWIILDEINLASPETLQFLTPLLDNNSSENSHIILYEKGSTEPLIRHPEFRLFGAMNPASDIGKRNLPINIRNRFTEIFVEELDNEEDLSILVKEYLHSLTGVTPDLVRSIVQFYLGLKNEEFFKQLTNGTGVSPNYSLRTLCRALKNASNNFCNNTFVSVYDGICLSFLTDLNRESSAFLEEHIKTTLFKSTKSKVISKILRKKPKLQLQSNFSETLDYIEIEDYWLLKGQSPIPDNLAQSTSYIFTKSIQENLKRLVRVCSAQLPCLIQGDTSIGKTSLVKWLAQATGNVLIRINNHDHTDLQEYIGSYVIEPSGKLIFKEGLLAKAMRHGYWILLDELNLASSEVLEALNRVLDDNRELFIPETQEVIKAHPRFVLFATQNPPGKYAGRKQLSRAFRNRFIELHFDELPEEELLLIVEKKCKLPASYAKLLIRTVTELKTKRSQMSGIFLGKHSLITLRDLFRWAIRYSNADHTSEYEDWKQYLAEQGLIILTSRCRSLEDVKTIHSCIEKVFGKKIDIENLSNPNSFCKPIMKELNLLMEFSLNNGDNAELKNFVWTATAKRTALLAGLAYKFNEPFLLVGETGIGKTTICQILALINSKYLNIVNCHMHSEAADFLGSIRPIRSTEQSDSNQLFEWQDGPLVVALREGQDFLIDEISLADDSVLERLNSVLEEERTLLVAENASSNSSLLVAHPKFRIFSTMNPGGDFGKKELSAALRNRFTEIWCPTPTQESEEFEIICNEKLDVTYADKDLKELEPIMKLICKNTMCSFLRWLSKQQFFSKKSLTAGTISIRDLMRWIKFINLNSNATVNLGSKQLLNPILALVHGAHLGFIDALNIETSSLISKNPALECTQFLFNTIQELFATCECLSDLNIEQEFSSNLFSIRNDEKVFGCGPFLVEKSLFGKEMDLTKQYCLNSKSTVENVQRIMRCMLMDNPIMLEGSPGVGKTSIVETLAKLTRNKVIRINLSEQTDLSDLFGADLPASETNKQTNSQTQKFCWRDGPFLLALKQGSWVILDEINLASQSVLEGLNSCFDHRGEIYVSELNRKFVINKNQTKIFACQNPYLQGGGRKGLPKSFLNRFSKVYVNKMSNADLLEILKAIYSDEICLNVLENMIKFNEKLNQEVLIERLWGNLGAPWEFNLRDLFRWCELIVKDEEAEKADPGNYVYLLYAARFRSVQDKSHVMRVFSEVFGYPAYKQELASTVRFTKTHLQIGQSFLSYPLSHKLENNSVSMHPATYSLTDLNLKHLEAIVKCLEMNWMVILVGSSCVGKTSLIRMVADLMNQPLIEFPVNNATDTSDLLGGYNKIEHEKMLFKEIAACINNLYEMLVRTFLELKEKKKMNQEKFHSILSDFFLFKSKLASNMSEVTYFEAAIEKLDDLTKKDKHLKFANCQVKDIVTNLEEIKKHKQVVKRKMNFEWVDSTLVKAIEKGEWLLIDNANFCNPSVLDRLNPLLEPNGNLQINEKGIGENGVIPTIQAHKNFRIILCMNESFGELSRPMRNRGVEIYLNEITPTDYPDDEKIILKSLYSFSDQDFNYFHQQLLKFQENITRKLNFPQILKIFKLLHDFWLVESDLPSYSPESCFTKALTEYKLNLIKAEALDQVEPELEIKTESKLATDDLSASGHHYYSNTMKLKEHPLYRYLLAFPLYDQFIEQLKASFLMDTKEIDLKNYFNLFIDSVKTSQMIEIWLRNIPIGSASNIMKFVNFSLEDKRLSQRFLREKIYSLFEQVALKTFNFKVNEHYQNLHTSLHEIGTTENIDLFEETLEFTSNRFLYKKLKKSTVIYHVAVLTSQLKLEIVFNLTEYRMNKCYTIQDDSILMISKNLDSDAMEVDENSVLKASFKFLSLFGDFFRAFATDCMKAMTQKLSNDLDEGQSEYENLVSMIKSTIYLFEKFYLICTSKFDPILSSSYLKYYWNFLHNNLSELKRKFGEEMWSNKLESFVNLFEQNLYYDNSVFEMYRKLWSQHRPNICIMNDQDLESCDRLNQKLVHLSSIYFQQSNYDALYEAIQHLNNSFGINKSVLAQSAFFSERLDKNALEAALSVDVACCGDNSPLKKLEYEDLLDELNATYIRSQNFPVYYFTDMLCEFESLLADEDIAVEEKYDSVLDDNSRRLITIKNLNHLVTKNTTLGKFGFLFDQFANKFVNFLKRYQNILKIGIEMDRVANQNSSFSVDSTVESKTQYLLNELKNTFNSSANQSLQDFNHKSILHYNWLNDYMIELFFKSIDKLISDDKRKEIKQKVYSYSTSMIQIKLCYFDHKLSQLNCINSFLWSNYQRISNVELLPELEFRLAKYLNTNVDYIKDTCFANDESVFRNYLGKRQFDSRLYELRNKLEKCYLKKTDPTNLILGQLLDITLHGCIVSHLFAPCDPLDPFEYEVLVKKCQDDEKEITRHEQDLANFNENNKLKDARFLIESHEEADADEQFYFKRSSQSDYFFIKNEFENCLKQFCSYERLGKLIEELFYVYLDPAKTKKTQALLDDEYKIWITSLEKFSEKMMNRFYSYADVVYLPLNGLALVGYGVKALYTKLRSMHAENNQASTIKLVNLLYTYPYTENHVTIARNLLDFVQLDNAKLNDELHLLSLHHLFNSMRYDIFKKNDIISTNQQSVHGRRTLLAITEYFNHRYRVYNEVKEEENKIETFKYKEYGQKEIEQELEDKELQEKFPSYLKFFNDFDNQADGLNDNVAEMADEEVVPEDEFLDEEVEKKNLIDLKFLVEAYDLIDKFYEFNNSGLSIENNRLLFENCLLKTFYSSYSIGCNIIQEQGINLPNTTNNENTLLSHIMFTSSINFDNATFNIATDNKHNEKFAYNIYHDSNHAEVVRSKKVLSTFKARINVLLNEEGLFENNPVLLELKKIIKRIESFDLNDPIMKFVTGLELLYQKSESWQLIGGKMYSIEPETRLVNALIVDWRKMELTFWQKSLELELETIKKRSAHIWFNHLFAICTEFLNDNDDTDEKQNEFFNALKKFIELSSIGDYFIRMKQLKICYKIFESNEQHNDKREGLLHSLWNVYNYFDVLYSHVIQDNINEQQVQIEKELKEFIQICRWQDFNYWALKSSTIKFNKGVFKIIRKFRVYLRGSVDLANLLNKKNLNKSVLIQDTTSQLNPKEFRLALKQLAGEFTPEQLENCYFNRNYYFKMRKLCKDSLIRKCLKTSINGAVNDFTDGIYGQFCEIDKAANGLMSTYQEDKNKESTAKYKKDIKGLINQKGKFISDLMKNLAFIGLSYRRGNLQYATDQDEPKKVIVFSPCVLTSFKKTRNLTELTELFAQTDFNYYLCVDRFFAFKEMMNSKTHVASKDINTVPIEKFRGYIEHLFQVIYRQKEHLHGFLNQLNCFSVLSDTSQFVAECTSFSGNNLRKFEKIKEYCAKTFDLIKQMEMFFGSVDEGAVQVFASSQVVKEKLNKQKEIILGSNFEVNKTASNDFDDLSKLNQNFKFKFTNTTTEENLQRLNSSYEMSSEFSRCLEELSETTKQKCLPFSIVIDKINQGLIDLNASLSGMPEVDADRMVDFEKIQELTNKITFRILKSVETTFKKSEEAATEEYPGELFEVKSKFIDESLNKFKTDMKTFDLENINGLLRKCLESVGYMENLGQLKQIYFSISVFSQLYLKFLTKYAIYLIDNHKQSEKCFYALMHIFTELKTKGFNLPDDFEDEETDDQENRNPNRKFEMDNQDDPAGLANNEEGKKDVSDQIENEDQLDDTKQKDAESDEEKDENKQPIEDNDKGIEMSEDFEAEMDEAKEDDQKNEKKEDDEDDGVDELEDLEDQKGEVDDDEQVLDDKLWDDEMGGGEESEDELDTLDEEDNPKKQNNKQQEMASKSDLGKSEENEDKTEGEDPKVDEKDLEGLKDEKEEDADDAEAENDKNQKINEQSDVENDDAENEADKETELDKEISTEKEPKPDDANDNQEGEEKEQPATDDIEMEDQKEDEENKDSETEPDQKDDNKNAEDEPMEDEADQDETKTDKNVDNKDSLSVSQNELKVEQEKPNNAQADENNAMCDENENEQNDQENEMDNEANSIQDKVSKNNKGKLGNQKSQFLDKVEENKRKKIGNKSEERVTSEDKDKLVENFNLIEIDEKIQDDNLPENKEEESPMENADAQDDLRHVQNENEKHDNQVYDAATDKQKKKVEKDSEEENKSEEKFDKNPSTDEKSKTDENMEMQKDISIEQPKDTEELKATENSKKDKKSTEDDPESKKSDDPDAMDIKQEADDEETKKLDSFYACHKENLLNYTTREEVETHLRQFRDLSINKEDDHAVVTSESLLLWQDYESLTQQMSKELCEQLRLILEPTVCSKLKGDYKSGKRLNMKRVIEYIATEYRKDKIWLRRIKPNKRDYQVMLAIDNSSSMGDNHCVQLAYETIATLMNAFNFLEVGQLGLLKFGERVSQLHDLQTNFHSDDGAKIISQIDFKDDTTQIAEMLDVSTDIFSTSASRVQRMSATTSISKLLVILSDGRGIFYEGIETVRNAIKKAMQEQIFIVFVLLETPKIKSSIFDIKMPIFTDGNPIPTIKSYMEQFPFPFYVVLKDVNNLPNIIGEALKEWFDMVARLDS